MNEENDLQLHLAKMIEHMEWENTLSPRDQSGRRLYRFLAGLGRANALATEHDIPWLLLGQIERILYHTEQVFGEDWREKAEARRLLDAVFEDEDEL